MINYATRLGDIYCDRRWNEFFKRGVMVGLTSLRWPTKPRSLLFGETFFMSLSLYLQLKVHVRSRTKEPSIHERFALLTMGSFLAKTSLSIECSLSITRWANKRIIQEQVANMNWSFASQIPLALLVKLLSSDGHRSIVYCLVRFISTG